MNRKEINAMTDEELCVKAAEIIGAKWYTPTMVAARYQYRHLCWVKPNDGWREAIDEDPIFLDYLSLIPDYPNDIAAAWKLLDKWVSDGGTYEFAWGGCYCDPNDGGAIHDNFVLLGTLALVTMERKTNTAQETARAITKAFIMAMESE